MALFLLSPTALEAAPDADAGPPVPELQVSDSRDDYSTYEGDGLWIEPFVDFLREIVARRCRDRGFSFSQDGSIDEDLYGEIPSGIVRALLVEFTNRHYKTWRDRQVRLPDYDEIASDCREFCDGCESGWTEIHGSYDGPLSEDVEPDEDEDLPGLAPEEREARRGRNRARAAERDRRQAAQEEAEEEVVDREFACEDDCDGYSDRVRYAYRDAFDPNIGALGAAWSEFLAETGEGAFPPLHPVG